MRHSPKTAYHEYYPTPGGTSADVIRAILELERDGLSLKGRHVREACWPLAAAAVRHFGCWGNALKAAGIDHEAVAKRRKWTVERVVQAIHRLDRQGVPLNYGSVYKTDSGLPQAATKLLGSWHNALRAAGYDPDQIRTARSPWTRAQIIELIQRRAAAGLPIATHNVVPQSAEVASRRLFGSWRAALKAAGVAVPMVQYPIWTKVSVIEGILTRQQAGQPIYCYAVADQASKLYEGARRYFGSWEEALRAAGIDPATVRRRHPPYTKDDVLAHLKRQAADGAKYSSPCQHPEPIVRAARRLFGSWQTALEAAGLASAEPDPRRAKRKRRRRKCQSRKRVAKSTARARVPQQDRFLREMKSERNTASDGNRNKYRSKEEVVRHLLERKLEGLSLRAVAVKRDDCPLHVAACRYFGTWRQALQAAEIEPESLAGMRLWTEDRLIRRIRELEHQGVMLNIKSVIKIDNGLTQAARARWGTWDDALRAAGFNAMEIRRQRLPWTKSSLVQAIRAHAASGLRVTTCGIRPRSIANAARRLFGSFEAAVVAARVSDKRNLDYKWSRAKVEADIRRRHQAGERLNSLAVTKENPCLYDAARRYHGGWDEALRAVGIDPDSVRLIRGKKTVAIGANHTTSRTHRASNKEQTHKPNRVATSS